MALRLGVDLDGVLADMDSALAEQAERLFGGAIAEKRHPEAAPDGAAAVRTLNLTPPMQRRLWKQVESIENFWETLVELEPQAIERLAALAAERRWEVMFLTRRPDTVGVTAQVQTQRWLQSKGFPLPSVCVVQGSRGRIAAALGLDAVIDDRAENCVDVVVDSQAQAILIWREDESRLPAAAQRLGITVVPSMHDCLDVLIRLDSAEPPEPGVMARVRRLFGVKQPALN